MEKMKLVLFLVLAALPLPLFAQAEADLWRCGFPRITPEERIAACTNALIVAGPEDPAPWFNRAFAHLALKDYRKAVLDFTAALRRNKDAKTHMLRGHAFSELGEYERALLDLEESLRLGPKNAEAHNSLAWVLATAGVPGFRDGKRAVELARKALNLGGWSDPGHLDTLAAAYAETGDFKEAVRWQEKALADKGFAEKNKDAADRLALYRARKPYRHVPG
jgi:tetratricopeptide (TPR) repeat protein